MNVYCYVHLSPIFYKTFNFHTMWKHLSTHKPVLLSPQGAENNSPPNITSSFFDFFFRPIAPVSAFFACFPPVTWSHVHVVFVFFLSAVCFSVSPSLSLSVCRNSGVKYNRLWYAALAFVTLMLFSGAVAALVFMGVFYTDPEACLLNKIFLGINGSLCFIVSLLAISPCIQKCKDLYL